VDINFQGIDPISVTPDGDQYAVQIGERHYRVQVLATDGDSITFMTDGKLFRAYAGESGGARLVALDATIYALHRSEPGRKRRAAASAEHQLSAQMPGQVIKVLAVPGVSVQRGDTLVILEAMKMELRVSAPYAGTIRKVMCQTGDVVDRGQVLLELDEQP
jgi:biotin carboxyl carrier protein